VVLILAQLVVAWFMQRDGSAGIHKSKNILRGGVCSIVAHAHYCLSERRIDLIFKQKFPFAAQKHRLTLSYPLVF
jgi:hypothetical protein